MFLTKTFSSKPMTVCGVLVILARLASAAELQEARVSQVIQDVRLLEAHTAPHAAAVNDKVIRGSAVRTGTESRAELTFNDLTITRLGANTIFSFTAGARQAELSQGAILLQVRPNAPPVKANTTAVTVAVMGGTALLSTGPPTKFMVLEGTGTIYPLGHPEKAVTVRGGEMVTAEGGRVNKTEKFDVKLVLATSPLITDFAPLANLPLIQTVMNQQAAEQSVLIATTRQPLIRDLINMVNVTDQSANSNPTVVQVRVETPTPSTTPPVTPTPSITPPPTPTPSTTPPVTPTPSKFGTPSTITSPNPYVITSGTTITTDPSITTNSVTDFGKIYRGPTDDGPFTLWAFGSTSAFDTALKIDTQFFADPSHVPIAVFKFESLLLNGDPTIDLRNGGVTKLALIGVDGITSGPPGGTLTFTGLDLLMLATVNGSINLSSDVSFQNLNELAMYARGTGSNVILDSPISGIGLLELGAEGSILLFNPGTMSVGAFHTTAGENLTLDIGGSLMLNGSVNLDTLVLPGTTVADAGNLTLSIHTDLTNASTTDLLRARVTNFQGQIGTGGNILVGIGGNFTTNSDAEFLIQNTAGTINNGGNMVFATGGSISTGGEFGLLIENYDETANLAGHIGTGGNLSLITGGNFTADFASIAINNRGGGRIDSGVSLTMDIAGALTTMANGPDFLGNTASLSVAISTRYDDTSGNTQKSAIGGDATLNLHADTASIGGNLSVFLSDRGGTIGGNALLNFNVTHDVTVTGTDVPMFSTAADIEILNDSGSNVGSPFGGTIHGDATLQVSAANFTLTDPAGSLAVIINNRNGGVIDSNATLSFNLAGNLTTQAYADFDIFNNQNSLSNGMPGGSIGSAATINFNAVNVSVGADFTSVIFNQRGAGAPGPGAGSIGTDATVNTTAASISVGGIFDVEIVNRDNGSGSGMGGSIGGNATINLNVANTLTSGGSAYFQIANESDVAGSPGGHIVGNAILDVSIGGDFRTTGDLFDRIYNDGGGFIGSDARINFNAASISIGGSDPYPFAIQNLTGGHIVGGAELDVTAGSLTGNSVHASIDNHDGGVIGLNAAVNLNVATISTTGDFGAFLGSFGTQGGGQIGGNASINVVAPSGITAGGDVGFDLGNNHGSGTPAGSIGGSATIDVAVTGGDISAGGAIHGTIDNQGSTIGGDAAISLGVSGAIASQNNAFFTIISNDDNGGTGPGTIAGNATINVNAGSISIGGNDLFHSTIFNEGGGTIGGNAAINFSISGDITTPDGIIFNLSNSGGTIGGNAAVGVNAANITANSLLAEIDNSSGGSIGGNTEGGATINMNVSNTATVTNDATVAIFGSDGAVGGAGININGGNYNVGGTFLSYIDGNGTITFNNAIAHADVLKAGVFGTNGVLNVGGGMLSANTELQLYAPGSNGSLNFVSNVTLGGNSLKILAANSVTIFNSVVVTIGGPNPADVYTTNANYTGFGGNGTTTGTFAGMGANNPQPLANAPPFSTPTPAPGVLTRGTRPSAPRAPSPPSLPAIHVNNTDQLLALLDGATVGPDGKVTLPASQATRDLRNSSRTDINALPRETRRILMQQMRDRSITRVGNRRIL